VVSQVAAAERTHFERQVAALNEELQASKEMAAELQASADAQSKVRACLFACVCVRGPTCAGCGEECC